MHAVSNAINILNSSIDNKICKKGAYSNANENAEAAGYCGLGKSSKTNSTAGGLQDLYKDHTNTSSGGGGYSATDSAKMGNHTSAKISADTAALSIEEKGVVSSVFAKVIEGAEIPELSNGSVCTQWR